jgi:hypothetical protein
MTTYTEPVSRLLALGAPPNEENPNAGNSFRDYGQLGISAEHIPDLIRLATDEYLHNEADPESPDVYAPIHAWRALGQLRAEAAIEPLLSLLHRIDDDDDDWAGEDLPHAFGLIGEAALSPLAEYVLNADSPVYAKIAAQEGIKEVALAYPETRARCVELLTEMMNRESFPGIEAEDARTLLGFVLSSLLKLKAIEALPEIQTAFEKDWIDISITGDFEDALIKLGELDERLTPKPNYHAAFMRPPAPVTVQDVELPPLNPADFRFAGYGKTPKTAKKAKSKNKMAKASKKKNRKK